MNKDIFCSAPWTSLFIDTNGEVKPCCASREPFGNIKNNTVAEIINGPKHLSVKQALLDGIKTKHCSYCYESEALSGDSTRSWFNNTTPVDNPQLKDYKLQMIDIRWSNFCNLRCLYCNPNSSSSIAEHWIQNDFVFLKTHNIQFDRTNKQSVRAWQSEIMQLVKDNILTIKEVYLLGGEPLLIKENLELINLITDQKVTLITNLSLDNTNNKIYKQLLTKPNVHWSISLENIGDKFEFIRNNASWKQIIHNIEELKKLEKNYSFTMQYCMYSAFDLYETLQKLKQYGNVDINLLIQPGLLVVTKFGEEICNLCIAQIEKVLNDKEMVEWLNVNNTEFLIQTKTTLSDANLVRDSTLPNLNQGFIDMQELNPGPHKFEDLWPEVWEILQRNK